MAIIATLAVFDFPVDPWQDAAGRYLACTDCDQVNTQVDCLVRTCRNDADGVVTLGGGNLTSAGGFDVITADPIHPWARGAAYLYTTEYYHMIARRLSPGGIA